MVLLLGSCAQSQECMSPPPSISFQLQDKAGNDVSSKFANRVEVSYTDKGQVKTVDVRTGVDAVQNRTLFFSYFPASAMTGVTDFTLKLVNGNSYPIQVSLNPAQDKCSGPTISRIEFNGQTVEPNRSLQPVTYLFTVE
jgi:hypothetical protein